jgi:hypothetical protein
MHRRTWFQEHRARNGFGMMTVLLRLHNAGVIKLRVGRCYA